MRGQRIDPPVGRRLVLVAPEDGGEPGQAVGAGGQLEVAHEQEDEDHRRGLGEDGEERSPDAAFEHQQSEQPGHQDRPHHRSRGREPEALERLPQQGELGVVAVQAHERGQGAFGHLFERQMHPHGVGAEPEEEPLTEGQHPPVTPGDVEADGDHGVAEPLGPETRVGRVAYEGGERRGGRCRRARTRPGLSRGWSSSAPTGTGGCVGRDRARPVAGRRRASRCRGSWWGKSSAAPPPSGSPMHGDGPACRAGHTVSPRVRKDTIPFGRHCRNRMTKANTAALARIDDVQYST